MTFSRRAGLAGALALLALVAFAAVAGASNAAVSIVDKSFQPADLTVNVGDTVTWTVTKSINELHTVTSGKPSDSDAGSVFQSGLTLKDDGQTFQFTFKTSGTFPYFCQVHPTEMTGTITVTGAGASGGPAASAAASPAASAAASAVASVPAASGGPAASGPAASPTEAPIPGSEDAPVPTQNKLTAAGILAVAIVLLFGAAAFYRRFNKV